MNVSSEKQADKQIIIHNFLLCHFEYSARRLMGSRLIESAA